jgi:hypothetical protein
VRLARYRLLLPPLQRYEREVGPERVKSGTIVIAGLDPAIHAD